MIDAAGLMEIQALVRLMPVGAAMVDCILDLVRAVRPGEGDPELTKHIAWGPGPRAAQSLMLACRARALRKAASRPARPTCWRWPARRSNTAWP